MNDQLNIIDIIDIFLRRWSIILLSAIVIGVFAFVYSEVFIAPVYSSTATLYVNSSKEIMNNEISQSDMNSSRQLVMTYAEILKGRTFLGRVSDDLDDKYTVSQLKGMITMDSLNETAILTITAKGTEADDVYRIVKSIVKYAPDELIRVVEAGSVKLLDDASETKTPVSPNIRQNTFIGIFLGLLIGALIVIVLELFDTRIKSGDEISQKYKEPLLGEIPSFVKPQNSVSESQITSGYANYKTTGGNV